MDRNRLHGLGGCKEGGNTESNTLQWSRNSKPRLTHIRHAYPKWHATCVVGPIFLKFLLSNQSLYIVNNIYICVCVSDCMKIVFELLLLSNNTASDNSLHKSGAVRSVDCLFVIRAPAWQ